MSIIFTFIFSVKKRLAIMLVFVSQTTFIYLFLWNYSLRIKVRIPQCNEFSTNIRLFGFPQRKYCSFWPFSFQLKRRWCSSSLADKSFLWYSFPNLILQNMYSKNYFSFNKGETCFTTLQIKSFALVMLLLVYHKYCTCWSKYIW